MSAPEYVVTARGERPAGPGWELVHAFANPTDGALWLHRRATLDTAPCGSRYGLRHLTEREIRTDLAILADRRDAS